MAEKKNVNNLKFVFIIGTLVLFMFLIIVSYAKSLVDEVSDKTEKQYYEKIEDIKNKSLNEQVNDFIIKGSIIPEVLPSDPVKGAVDKYKLTIIEYGDFQCPFCADMAKNIDRIVYKYADVRVIWKDLPNPAHLNAKDSALAARCAQEQDKFWQYHDVLFDSQDDISSLTIDESFYTTVAEKIGLDLVKFNRCLSSEKYLREVMQGIEDANKYNIDGTPYLFVGSKRVEEYVSYQELEDIVESMLLGKN